MRAPAFLRRARDARTTARSSVRWSATSYGPAVAEALAVGPSTRPATRPARTAAAVDHFTAARRLGRLPEDRAARGRARATPRSRRSSSPATTSTCSRCRSSSPTRPTPVATSPPATWSCSDEKLGTNVGTYRCQIKTQEPDRRQRRPRARTAGDPAGEAGARREGRALRDRGRHRPAHVRGVVREARRRPATSEYRASPAGCAAGPVDVVRAEHSDLLVPAHAEIVIEGEIPLDATLPEGPFAELYGYLGTGWPENWFMNVTAVTHRRTRSARTRSPVSSAASCRRPRPPRRPAATAA